MPIPTPTSAEVRQMYEEWIGAWVAREERHRRSMLVLAAEVRRNYLLSEQDESEIIARINQEINKATDW